VSGATSEIDIIPSRAAATDYDTAAMEQQRLADPPLELPAAIVHGPPPPLAGGPFALWRFMRAHGMLNRHYAMLLARLAWTKLRLGDRLQLDGIAFICSGVHLEVAPGARLVLGRWSWLGNDCKVRVHEGVVEIGAKSVLGQECTLTCFRRIAIGRDCIIADKVMMLDFDHGVVDVERPIREQGIYKRPVEIGHNCWIGYGASILRGVKVGQNCVIGTNSVVTKDVPDNAVVGGVPARVLRLRPAPQAMRYD
jgi:acetyltransferase-like isoleucine patch superfamily enzyme